MVLRLVRGLRALGAGEPDWAERGRLQSISGWLLEGPREGMPTGVSVRRLACGYRHRPRFSPRQDGLLTFVFLSFTFCWF